MPASARGSTPKWSLPTGIPVAAIAPCIGAASITPIPTPVNTSNPVRTRSPTRRPTSRYTVPSASHGTLITAPSR